MKTLLGIAAVAALAFALPASAATKKHEAHAKPAATSTVTSSAPAMPAISVAERGTARRRATAGVRVTMSLSEGRAPHGGSARNGTVVRHRNKVLTVS